MANAADAIKAALSDPVIVQKLHEELVKMLSQQEHPLDRDWHRVIEKEAGG